MEFTKDEYGREILLKDGNLQVMMEWEKPYMIACVDALKPTGDVLEIGFGLGYSATHIQSYHPKSHTIIECDPEVLKHAKAFAKKHKGVTIVEGTWEEQLKTLGKFDQIFFDDYTPFSEAEVNEIEAQIKEHQQAVGKATEVQQKLRLEIERFKGVVFSDPDITNFLNYLQNREDIDSKDVVQFVEQLVERGNITAGQKTRFLREYHVSTALAAAESVLSGEHAKDEALASLSQQVRSGDRLMQFVELSLNNHMRPKARLSAYIDYYQFQQRGDEMPNWLKKQKGVTYTETVMDVTVPPNCRYYKGDKALILVITRA